MRSRERIHSVNVRLTHDEYDALVKKTKSSGLTISEFVRRVISGRKVVSRVEQNLINELRRQGGLLKLIHVESRGAYSSKTAAAIDELRNLVRTLTKEIHQNQ